MTNIISAVFDRREDARDAVDWLRSQGVQDDAISIVSQQGDDVQGHIGSEGNNDGGDAADAGKGALTGVGIGAGVGALFGLAAAAIPGIGPFITAGALSAALGPMAGGAAAGAIVGGTSGGLAGAFSHWGLNEADAQHYAGEVERGGTYVGVDLTRSRVPADTVRDAFRQYNGRFNTV